MTEIFLFAGTIEGKELAEKMCSAGLTVHAFTATEYGGSLLAEKAADEAASTTATTEEASATVLTDEAAIGEAATTATANEAVAVATGKKGRLSVTSARLDEAQMLALMQRESPRLVIDATHPYAIEVSKNIRAAAGKANIRTIRVKRQESDLSDRKGSGKVVHVSSAEAAAEFLAQTEGNVLLTCGSKELPVFAKVEHCAERFFARVLSTEGVVSECAKLGFAGKHLIAMQGPFSLEMNRALIRHTNAAWLVTKESGVQGGFPEKEEAAALEGIGLLIIDRPADLNSEAAAPAEGKVETAESMGAVSGAADPADENAGGRHATSAYCVYDTVPSCLKDVYRFFGVEGKRKFTLLGIGPGDAGGLTIDGLTALAEADVVLGATRMLQILKDISMREDLHIRGGSTLAEKTTFMSWKPAEMDRFVKDNPQYQNVVVALSGDTGFYSGAAKLLEVWKEEDVRVLPGLSTLQVLCAKVKTDWQHVYCISRHGRAGNLLTALRLHEAVFLLPGETLSELCGKLLAGGFSDVKLAVGSKLSYEDETVLAGTPEELKECACEAPYAVLIANPKAGQAVVTPGIPDADFLRVKADGAGKITGDVESLSKKPGTIADGTGTKKRRTVPMTKEEVRTVSLAKLRLTKNAVVYDVGAGSGSVSVEAARIAYAGCVYAIEQNPAAVELLHENRRRFALDNMEIIEGMAPEAMADLPAPTHAFIGGSKGNLSEIVSLLQKKNPNVRIVINTVTVETELEARKVLESLVAKRAEATMDRAKATMNQAGSDPSQALGNTPSDFQSEVIHMSVTREERVGGYHMQRAENPIAIISFGKKAETEG